MFTALRQMRELVNTANQIAAIDPGDAPRWSLFITNRSFLTAALAFVLTLLNFVGLPAPPWLSQALVESILTVAPAILLAWSFIERTVIGKTRAIWNVRQARKAVGEAIAVNETPQAQAKADKLTEALQQAGQPAVKP